MVPGKFYERNPATRVFPVDFPITQAPSDHPPSNSSCQRQELKDAALQEASAKVLVASAMANAGAEGQRRMVDTTRNHQKPWVFHHLR